MTKEELKRELYHYIATQCSAISINMEHRLVYHYDQMEKVGEFIYNLEEKRIEELENQIADIKANCDLAIEGRDIKIKELEQENAGLKAGRPQWHDLEKEPTDLPKDNHNVWCKALDHYGEGWYDKDTNTWTLIYRGYHLHCIEAWCEIPTFDKE